MNQDLRLGVNIEVVIRLKRNLSTNSGLIILTKDSKHQILAQSATNMFSQASARF